MEIQYLLAFRCYDSPSIIQRGESMNESHLWSTMYDLYYGAKDDDPETLCYLDQCINGLHQFQGLFVNAKDPDEYGRIVLTMQQKLHRIGGAHIFDGPGSITREIVSQTNFTNTARISGASLLAKAKAVVKTCKKMTAIVTASGSPYRDGSFPSGTNWDDYIKWCLVEMQKEFDREERIKKPQAATAGGATLTGDDITTTIAAASTATTVEASAATGDVATATTTTEIAVAASRKDANHPYFKCGSGFLVWALYGYIPLLDGVEMASHLFSAVKVSGSYGRGSKARKAMRKAAMTASSVNVPPVDNRRGKKQKLGGDELAVSIMPPNNDADEIALLAQTLQHLEAETLEKEEKQHHSMRVRLVRDKLIACKRRSDVLLQQLQLSSKYKKKADTDKLDKLDANEAEIEKLETELETLQEEECGRHRQMLEKKKLCMLNTTTPPMIGKGDSFESFTTSSGLESSSSGGNADDDNDDDRNDGDDGNDNHRNDGDNGNGGSTYPVMSTPRSTPGSRDLYVQLYSY